MSATSGRIWNLASVARREARADRAPGRPVKMHAADRRLWSESNRAMPRASRAWQSSVTIEPDFWADLNHQPVEPYPGSCEDSASFGALDDQGHAQRGGLRSSAPHAGET